MRRTAHAVTAVAAVLVALLAMTDGARGEPTSMRSNSAAPTHHSAFPLPELGCYLAVRVACVQSFPWQSGLDRLDQRNLPVDERYVYNYTGSGVHVYVVDDGIDVTDADFEGRAAQDFSALVTPPVRDHRSCTHATLVAKTIGGAKWGVAKQASLHSVRVRSCDVSGTQADLLEGLRWVRQNAQRPAVVNLSLGTIGNSSTVNGEVAVLINAGLPVVVAAGQDNVDACGVSPARVSAALTVAASSTLDRPITYSNYGPCIDLFAPGQFIAQTFAEGSSYAAGHASGVAALHLQRDRTLTPAALHNRIIASATSGVMSGLRPNSNTPNRLLYGRVVPPDPPVCCA